MVFADSLPSSHGSGAGRALLTRRDTTKIALAGLLAGAASVVGRIAPVLAQAPAQSVKDKIDELLRAQVDKGIAPGIAAAISKVGRVIHTASAGVRDVETGAPMLPTTPQHIGSVSKQFTAACVLLLQQDGRLLIDDTLSKHVPEISYGGRVTLRQMLNMVSGLSDNDPAIYGDGLTQPIARPAMLANLDKLPLIFEPGSKMAYTNTNYNLVGFIIERVSGMKYLDFLHKHIFGPLEMKSSSTMDVPLDGTATGYSHARPGEPFVQTPEMSNDFAFATGNIISTPLDLLAWDAGLLSGKVLKAASLREMFAVPGDGKIMTVRESEPSFEVIKGVNDGGPTIYAMGWMVPNSSTRWHGGHTFLYQSANVLFDDGYAIAAAGNVRDAGTFSPKNVAVELHNLLNPALTLPPVFVLENKPPASAVHTSNPL
jgi:CubicO group peptidase (beta-lactamase class C family)